MATTTLLAGDMGGTKTLLALYGSEAGQLRPAASRTLPLRGMGIA